MHGIPLTIETLGKSRNESAIDVLISIIVNSNGRHSKLAFKALTGRGEPAAAAAAVKYWKQFGETVHSVAKDRAPWFENAVTEQLRMQGPDVLAAIHVAKTLKLHTTIDPLASVAESAQDKLVQGAAIDAILFFANELGSAARQKSEVSLARTSVMNRLWDSVRHFADHGRVDLVDAFLSSSTWGDAPIRHVVAKQDAAHNLVMERFAESDQPGVAELLAGFIKRRNLEPALMERIFARTDAKFRIALLQSIGSQPNKIVCYNIKDTGLPKSCRDGADSISELPPMLRGAMVQVYGNACNDPIELINVAATAIQCGGEGVEEAVVEVLQDCAIPSFHRWLKAVPAFASDDEAAIQKSTEAKLLRSLIGLLRHPNEEVAEVVNRVLTEIQVDEVVARISQFREVNRIRLGKIVRETDPMAIERVKQALRHPVMKNRIDAIDLADAMAFVDLLGDSFTRIVRDDHQLLRIKAATVLGRSQSSHSIALLEEMLTLPESQVRDAARIAINHRSNHSSDTSLT